MCLYTGDKTFNIATNNIICYKVVEKSNLAYFSIIHKYSYKVNKLAKSKIGKIYNNRVEKGLHTFKYLREAKCYLRRCESTNVCILQCIIPKNSIYFSGLFICEDRGFSSYVSDKLLPIKEIN